MDGTENRCMRPHCGYAVDRCQCPEGPLLSAPIRTDDFPDLMMPGEVAAVFRVDPHTVTRWAQQGKLRSIRTLGGHRRYRAADVRAFLDEDESGP